MPEDHYALSGPRWALGAEFAYRPIAAALVAASPHPPTGRIVLDAGAGAGAASTALRQRVTRAGGAILAAVFGSDSHSEARDQIDAAALAAARQVPAWYREMKAAAARGATLTHVYADERQIDVGIADPAQLVRYRLGHPIFAPWLVRWPQTFTGSADTRR